MNRRDALKTFAAVAAGGSLPAAGAVVTPLSFELRNILANCDRPITLPPWQTWLVKLDGDPRWHRCTKLADEHGPAEYEAIA